MKKSIIFSLLFALSFSVSGQWVTIPDTNFAIRLNQLFPECMDGDQMNTECEEIINATSLTAFNLQITNLSGLEHFVNLQYLECSKNNLTALPELPPLLTTLRCYENYLTSLPELPVSLTQLRCWENNLTSLPELPITLTQLRCWGNNLTYLPELPPGLSDIHCNSNNLTSLPDLPASLTVLYCHSNNLTSLPELSPSLTHLRCSYNNLTSLPELPATLIFLYCYGNDFTTLPELPSSLTYLYCFNNNLNSLPELPSSLTDLYCYSNNLSSLPELPATLTDLDCAQNNLTSLPELPSTLKILRCSNNILTSLPILPQNMTHLRCANNNLTNLPALPPTLGQLHCNNNQIACLPILPMSLIYGNVSAFNISGNPFTCLPNYVPAMNETDIQWLAYPLCDLDDFGNNPFGCRSAAGIGGTVFKDETANCIEDGPDSQLANIQLKLFNESSELVSTTSTFGNTINNSTFYHFIPGLGAYSVMLDTENMPFQASCTIPGNEQEITLSEASPSALNVDFGVECLPGFDIGVQSVVTTGWVFPGQVHTLKIAAGEIPAWFGIDCSQNIGGKVNVFVSGPVSYFGPAANSLTPSITGNLQFTYDIANFSQVNMQQDFALMLKTDTTAQLGDLICVNIIVNPIDNDLNPTNNSFNHCYSVVNSYDPNIKQHWPRNVQPGFDGYFNYIIYFQNTGSAPAFNIRLADTLDTNLDVNTFQVTNYSHPVNTSLSGQVLTFRFFNIMLPDSTSDFEGSIGYVQYRIKPKADLPLGTVIENTAHIFFDFNDAIVTNTTQNEYVIKPPEAEVTFPELLVFPNPSRGVFNVSLINGTQLSTSSTLEIYNLRGQRILQQQMNENQTVLDLSNQPAGIYMLRLQNTFGTKTMKLVIQ